MFYLQIFIKIIKKNVNYQNYIILLIEMANECIYDEGQETIDSCLISGEHMRSPEG